MASFNQARVSLLIVGAIYSCACSGGAQGESQEELSENNAASAQVEVTCAAGDEHFIDLGALDPPDRLFNQRATAINNHGTVVGTSGVLVPDKGIEPHAYRWKADTGMVDLGALDGVYSYATSVNEAGEVAGSSSLPNQPGLHAVMWDAQNRIRDLGTLGGSFSDASGINNRGQVVGVSEDATGLYHAFIWDAKTGMVDMGPSERPGGPLIVSGINDFGVVVGTWASHGGPFKWTKEEGLTMLDLMGNNYGEANAINNLGEIVGFINEGSCRPMALCTELAVKWTDCGSSRLARTPNQEFTVASGINDRGVVVGADFTYPNRIAIEWQSATHVAPLPLGQFMSDASDVNDCGDVVGSFRTLLGDDHSFLWQPARAGQ